MHSTRRELASGLHPQTTHFMKTLGAAVLTSLALLPVRWPTMGPEPPDGNPLPPGNARQMGCNVGCLSTRYPSDISLAAAGSIDLPHW